SLVEKTYKTSEQDYSFKQEYKISSPANLQIATTGGNINVNGMNDSTIEVSYIVTKNGKVLDITFDELKEIADVEIINSDTSLNIRIIRTKEKRISIGFNIKTPLKTSINLNTSGG